MFVADLLYSTSVAGCAVPTQHDPVRHRQKSSNDQRSYGIDEKSVVEVHVGPQAPGRDHGTDVEVDHVDRAQKVLVQARIGDIGRVSKLRGKKAFSFRWS